MLLASKVARRHEKHVPAHMLCYDSWLAVDPWEVTRKRIMDYMSVLEHAKEVCHETFPGHAGGITILYMCQASQVTKIPVFYCCQGTFEVRVFRKKHCNTDQS